MIEYLKSLVGMEITLMLRGASTWWGPYLVKAVQVDTGMDRAVLLLSGMTNSYAINVDQIAVVIPPEGHEQ